MSSEKTYTYWTDADENNHDTYMNLKIINCAEGNFEVIHNGVKKMMINFHYDQSRNGEYILPHGVKRYYLNGEFKYETKI